MQARHIKNAPTTRILSIAAFILLTTAAMATAYVGQWRGYLDNSRINALIEYSGHVYAGTEGGIRRIEPGTLSIQNFGNFDGLIDPWIVGFAADSSGVLWAASRDGYLYSLAGKNRRWEIRSRSYAAQQWRMSDRAMLSTGSYLYLGTTKGLALFDTRKSISQLNITRFGNDIDVQVFSVVRRQDTLYVGTASGVYKARVYFSDPVNPPAGYANLADYQQWIKIALSPNTPFNHLVFFNDELQTFSAGTVLYPGAPDDVRIKALAGSPLEIGSQVYQERKNLVTGLNSGNKVFVGGSEGLLISMNPSGVLLDAEPLDAPPSFLSNGNERLFPRDTISNIGAGGNRAWGHSPAGLWRPDETGKKFLFQPAPLPYEPELYTRSLRNTKVDGNGRVYVGSWGGGVIRGRDTLLQSGDTLIRLLDVLYLSAAQDMFVAPLSLPRASDIDKPLDTLAPIRDTVITVFEKWDKNSPDGACIQEIIAQFPVVHALGQPRGRDLFFAMYTSFTTAIHQLVHLDTESGRITCIDSTLVGTTPHAVEILFKNDQVDSMVVGVAHDLGVTFTILRQGPDGPVAQSSALWTVSASANEAWDIATDRWGRPWALINDQLTYLDSLDTSPSRRLKPIDNFIGSSCKSIEADPIGLLWVGCANGLFQLTTTAMGEIASVRPYGRDDGLPSLSIYDISIDVSNGKVWVATARGVVMLESASQPPIPSGELAQVVPYPNPFRPGHRFVIFRDLPFNSTLRIHDPAGRVVRIFAPRDLLGNDAQWDGNNEQGKPVPPGVYPFSITSGSTVRRGKVIVAR